MRSVIRTVQFCASGSVSAAVDPKEGGNGAAGVHPLMYTGALQTVLLAVVLAYYI